jgi:hypothetical protein
MRVLVACEFSGIVRDAFTAYGHEAWSVDLLPSELPGLHVQADIIDFLRRPWTPGHWDLMIAFPPCTYLARSGAQWWPGKQAEQLAALEFVRELAQANIPKIAIENPIGKLSSAWRKPDQIIQPWMFGHGQVKATCLWLYGLPALKPTLVVEGRKPTVHMAPDSKDRWKKRSRTLMGLAYAMAEQWGGCVKCHSSHTHNATRCGS